LTSEHTTLHQHTAALHAHCYRKWCESNCFNSMLPEDAKLHKSIALDKSQQSSVIEHFGPEHVDAKPTPYSHEAFKNASIVWLIKTNQPIQAFSHPKFKMMIDVASRARCEMLTRTGYPASCVVRMIESSCNYRYLL
ncbi:hypothetical protein EI94DRAFT_1565549, partial [Lactarius quietus]